MGHINNVIETCKFLNDPQLVARFQKWCGIIPIAGIGACGYHSRGGSDVNGDALNVNNHNKELNENWKCNNIVHSDKNSNSNVNGDACTAKCAKTQKDENVKSTPTCSSQYVIKRTHHKGNSEDFHSETELANNAENYISEYTSEEDEEDTNQEYVVTNRFFYYLFHLGASMGNEIFYITFFPFWFWNIDGYVGRRICVFWCLFMYLGQATKDIVKWPRPSAPPVFRMEMRYALEYGMPSTHAMVGAGIPFAILILTMNRYVYPFEIGLLAAIVWCIIVCLSRIYLGMHSVLDVLVGLAYVFLLMLLFVPVLDHIDNFLLHASYAPIIAVVVPLILSLAYPTPTHWSTARGDTTLILGVGSGVAVGNWLSVRLGSMLPPLTPPPYQIIPPSLPWVGEVLVRLSLGVVMLLATRAIVGTAMRRLVCSVTGVDASDCIATRRLAVELPYKFVTYSAMAFNAVFLAPQVFRYLGVERETYFTEL